MKVVVCTYRYLCTGDTRLPHAYEQCTSKEMLWQGVKKGTEFSHSFCPIFLSTFKCNRRNPTRVPGALRRGLLVLDGEVLDWRSARPTACGSARTDSEGHLQALPSKSRPQTAQVEASSRLLTAALVFRHVVIRCTKTTYANRTTQELSFMLIIIL